MQFRQISTLVARLRGRGFRAGGNVFRPIDESGGGDKIPNRLVLPSRCNRHNPTRLGGIEAKFGLSVGSKRSSLITLGTKCSVSTSQV